MKILDIIIPQWSEKRADIWYMLASIQQQMGFDLAQNLNVIIVNDHNPETYEDLQKDGFLEQWAFPITLLQTPKNGGPGAARQYGLDRATAPCVTFLDADDRLYSADSFVVVLSKIAELLQSNQPWAYVWTYFYEQVLQPNGSSQLLSHNDPNVVWMHGKFWNRQWLVDNKIHFLDTSCFEDTFFCKNAMLRAKPQEVLQLPVHTYLWMRNSSSLSSLWNHDGRTYMYWRHDACMKNQYTTLKEGFAVRDKIEQWKPLFFTSAIFLYLLLCMQDFADNEPKTLELRETTEDMFHRICVEFSEGLHNITAEEMRQLYYLSLTTNIKKFPIMVNHEGWNDFLDRMTKKYDYDFTWMRSI